jgi:cbb3-type cytochrome oxidase maturation protein
MTVLVVLVFVSIVLVAGGLLLFFFSLNQRDFEHADRLSLLPLAEPGVPSGPMHAPPHAPACAPARAQARATPSPTPVERALDPDGPQS